MGRWGIINDAGCDFAKPIQTMHQILEECALIKFLKGLEDLQQVTEKIG